jgi:NTE family protein
MADVGVDVRDAAVIVGTSAGSLVGVQIASDLTLRELFHRQADPQLQTKESQPPVDAMRWRMDFMRAKEGPASPSRSSSGSAL